MDEARFQSIKGLALLASFVAVLAIQLLSPWRRPPGTVPASWRQNVPLAVLNAVVMAITCGACLCTVARYAADRGLGLFHLAALPAWVAVPGTIVALDFVLWTWHLASHRVSWLWRFHRVHHSDLDFDVATSLRFHAGELLLSLPLKLAAVLLLGAPILGLLLFEIAFGAFNLLVHGNIRMPSRWESRLSWLFVLPAVHRAHHSVDARLHQRNFGTLLSAWDRAFGTWVGGCSNDAVTVGLPDLLPRGSLSLWQCLALPFGSASRKDSEPGPRS